MATMGGGLPVKVEPLVSGLHGSDRYGRKAPRPKSIKAVAAAKFREAGSIMLGSVRRLPTVSQRTSRGVRVTSPRDSARVEAARRGVLHRTMSSILNVDAQRQLFLQFLRLDYCVELSKFITAYSEYESLYYNSMLSSMQDDNSKRSADEALLSKAQSIYDTFLSPNGAWFINASSENTAAVERELAMASNRGLPDINVFSAVQREILDYCAKCKLMPFKEWLETSAETWYDDVSIQSSADVEDDDRSGGSSPARRLSSLGSAGSSVRRTSILVRRIIQDIKAFEDTPPPSFCDSAVDDPSDDDSDGDSHNVWGESRTSAGSPAAVKDMLVRIWGEAHFITGKIHKRSCKVVPAVLDATLRPAKNMEEYFQRRATHTSAARTSSIVRANFHRKSDSNTNDLRKAFISRAAAKDHIYKGYEGKSTLTVNSTPVDKLIDFQHMHRAAEIVAVLADADDKLADEGRAGAKRARSKSLVVADQSRRTPLSEKRPSDPEITGIEVRRRKSSFHSPYLPAM